MTTLPATLLKLNAEQAAEYAHAHVDTIRRFAALGTLHGSQRKSPGGKWLFDRECLDAWLAGEKCQHQQAEAAR